jgi:4'-phosphopantetheinyl transferase
LEKGFVKELQIEENEIHLWQLNQADYDLSSLQSECLAWLTEPELQRFRRFQFDRHRKQLLLGRALMRTALSIYDSSIAPADWIFTQNKFGKPFIGNSGADSLYFNLSHSAGKAVLAVSRCEQVGVDIESANKARRIAAIAKRYFSEREAAALLSLPESLQHSRFYDLWTLKEAYIKACGMGLAIPLQHFSFEFLAEDRLGVAFDAQRNDDESAWRFWQISAGADYKLAVAAKVGAQRPEFALSSWSLNALNEYHAEDVSVVRCS